MKAIAAISKTGIIGIGNRLPWNHPEDLEWFKKHTLDCDIIMGRKTLESLPKILPRRTHHVLATKGGAFKFDGEETPPVKLHVSLESLPEDAWVCGGAEVYKQLLPKCDELYLTIIKPSVLIAEEDLGDLKFFPKFVDMFSDYEIIDETDNCQFRIYKRNEM